MQGMSGKVLNLPNPKPGHTAGGFGQGGARRRGGAGRDGTPAGRIAQETTDPLAPKASNIHFLDGSSDARTNEILLIFRVQNTEIPRAGRGGADIPRAGRGGAAHGKAAGRSRAGQSRTPTGRFAQGATVPSAFHGFQGIEDKLSRSIPQEHEQKKSQFKPNGGAR